MIKKRLRAHCKSVERERGKDVHEEGEKAARAGASQEGSPALRQSLSRKKSTNDRLRGRKTTERFGEQKSGRKGERDKLCLRGERKGWKRLFGSKEWRIRVTFQKRDIKS